MTDAVNVPSPLRSRSTAIENRWLSELVQGVIADASLARDVVDLVPVAAFDEPHRRVLWSRLTEVVHGSATDSALSIVDVVWWCRSPEAAKLRVSFGVLDEPEALEAFWLALGVDVGARSPISRDRALDLAQAGVAHAASQAAARSMMAATKRQLDIVDAGGKLDPLHFTEAVGEVERAATVIGVSQKVNYQRRHRAAIARIADPNRPARVAVPTGLAELDRALRKGFGVGELAAVALPTGKGKTLLAGAICRGAIWPESGRPLVSDADMRVLRERIAERGSSTRVLLWVGEDSADLVWSRIAQDILDADSETLDDPEKREQFFARRERVVAEMIAALDAEDCPVTVIDRHTLKELYGGTGRELDSLVRYARVWADAERREAEQRGEPAPKLLVAIDYVQIVEVDPKLGLERTKELRYVSQAFCDLAENHAIAVLVFAQMNGRLNHQSTEDNSMREAADIEHACSLVVYGDSMDAVSARQLRALLEKRKDKDDAADAFERQRSRVAALGPGTLELTFRKGRKVGRANATPLHVDYERQRIVDMSAEHQQLVEDYGESPLKVARDLLAPPKRGKQSDTGPTLKLGRAGNGTVKSPFDRAAPG